MWQTYWNKSLQSQYMTYLSIENNVNILKQESTKPLYNPSFHREQCKHTETRIYKAIVWWTVPHITWQTYWNKSLQSHYMTDPSLENNANIVKQESTKPWSLYYPHESLEVFFFVKSHLQYADHAKDESFWKISCPKKYSLVSKELGVQRNAFLRSILISFGINYYQWTTDAVDRETQQDKVSKITFLSKANCRIKQKRLHCKNRTSICQTFSCR